MVVLKAASMPKARARAGEPPSPPPLTPSSSSFASAPWAEAETSLVLTAFWHFAPEGDDSDRSRSRESCRRCPESEEVWILTVMVLERTLVQKSRAKPSNLANPYNFYLRLKVHETFVSRKARKIRGKYDFLLTRELPSGASGGLHQAVGCDPPQAGAGAVPRRPYANPASVNHY